MERVGIVTLNGYSNFGNRLQNYALQEYLKSYCIPRTICVMNSKIEIIKQFIKKIMAIFSKKYKRINYFIDFNKKYMLTFYCKKISLLNNYFDKYVVGSDQVWNCTFDNFNNLYFLNFSNKKNNIAYAASFGISDIPKQFIENYKIGLNNINNISVREDSGKNIVEKITGRKDCQVLIDPTMLLTSKQWDNIVKKPKKFNYKKFILCYFLGEISNERKRAIEKVAVENDCVIINLLDKSDQFYCCGPREFLYLEKNAFLICTDSFHSSVFALLYDRPFVIFDRDEKNMNNMGSRIDTLLKKFKLNNRKFNGKFITEKNLKHNYAEAYKILDKEKAKSESFFKNIFEKKDSDFNE